MELTHTNGAAQSQSIDAGNATNTNGTSSKNTVQLPSNTQPQRNDTPRNSRGRNAALAGAHPRQKPTAVPKVQAAPAVPSFGFSLPTVKPEVPIAAGASDQAQGTKKRKFNQLGLTPRSEVLVESEEEEVDEEQKFANVGGVLQFEYKGRSSTLKSPEEIAAWIEERKKRFPTKARIEEKAKLDAEKKVARQQMADRVTAEKKAHEKSVSDKRKKQKTQPEANDDDRRRKTMEKHLRKAEKLRKQLQQEEEKAARAARAANPVGQGQSTKAKLLEAGSKPSLGLAYDSEDSHDEDDESEDDASSVVSSSSEDISSDSDETSDDSDDSDAPPDEETSVKRPIKVAPPARKPREGPQPKPARKERQKDQPQKRQTLRDRWVEQEKREEAKQALQAIKFLGESGFLG
ncbi:hypothetical protein K490DRAFT_67565 [Saccharata proteae CBS 121410]|uniref:FMR1-interacting protein 1 conserved domain-containing protein n=1 Tax=Saccharata proteae CBS 121410 TaxID=1314787 RepID=A0A9P4HUV0_9PEZI|nr:hypothetical protein K490DRAFT_67565 [Saccharata proteae CBS 121410]